MPFSLLQSDSCSGLKHIPAILWALDESLLLSQATLMAILPIGMFFATVSFNVLTVMKQRLQICGMFTIFCVRIWNGIEVPAPKSIVGQWTEPD